MTRLGPERAPFRTRAQGKVCVWESDPTTRAGRGGPMQIGIFLLVFGALLLLQQAVPEVRTAGSALVLAIGSPHSSIKWPIDRGTGSSMRARSSRLLPAPRVLKGRPGSRADGLGALCFGIAFLFIGSVQAVTRGGLGWQVWSGVLSRWSGGVNVGRPGCRRAMSRPGSAGGPRPRAVRI